MRIARHSNAILDSTCKRLRMCRLRFRLRKNCKHQNSITLCGVLLHSFLVYLAIPFYFCFFTFFTVMTMMIVSWLLNRYTVILVFQVYAPSESKILFDYLAYDVRLHTNTHYKRLYV